MCLGVILGWFALGCSAIGYYRNIRAGPVAGVWIGGWGFENQTPRPPNAPGLRSSAEIFEKREKQKNRFSALWLYGNRFLW